jgi:hypothetical protein
MEDTLCDAGCRVTPQRIVIVTYLAHTDSQSSVRNPERGNKGVVRDQFGASAQHP